MITAIIAILFFLTTLAFSWCITVGIVYVIMWCFSLTFSIKIATGIWLVLFLLGSLLGRDNTKE